MLLVMLIMIAILGCGSAAVAWLAGGGAVLTISAWVVGAWAAAVLAFWRFALPCMKREGAGRAFLAGEIELEIQALGRTSKRRDMRGLRGPV